MEITIVSPFWLTISIVSPWSFSILENLFHRFSLILVKEKRITLDFTAQEGIFQEEENRLQTLGRYPSPDIQQCFPVVLMLWNYVVGGYPSTDCYYLLRMSNALLLTTLRIALVLSMFSPASMGQMGRPAAFDITLSLMSSSFLQGRYKADSSSSEISDNRRVSINTFELPLPKCSNIGTISITSLVVSHFTSIFFLGRNEFLYDNASIYLDANSRGIRS